MQNITEEIIEQAAAGDESAFEIIYKVYFSFVSNVAYRIVSKQEESEEICQEVFMIIYRKLKNFRGESALKTWIYRITINYAVKYSKRLNRQKKGVVEYDENVFLTNREENIRDKMDAQNNEKMIEGLLEKLNSDQRACIVLRSLEGLSYQEISAILKIPINTVRSRIKRAREIMIALRNGVMVNEM